jgi:imidazolonepropionase-like amidohydrolase
MFAIRARRMFDGETFSGGPVTVLVDGGRISAIEADFPELGDGWTEARFDDATVLPGLIDTHVHLVADSGDWALDRVPGYSDRELYDVISEGLQRQLAAGVTTVRDLGDRRFNVANRGRSHTAGSSPTPAEPTVLASGPPLTSPGGHCFFLGGEVADRSAMAAAIAERADHGVDIVKIMASGGMNTPGTDVMRTQFTDDELAFLVDEAHAAGLPVTAHAHGLPAVEQALAAGVDAMEHCSCLTEDGVRVTDEVLETLVKRQIPVGAALVTPPPEGFNLAPPAVKAMLQRAGVTPEKVRAMRLQTVARMHQAGVRFVAGRDSGLQSWLAHGSMWNAVAFYVEAGATTAEAAAAATSRAAEACGIADHCGRLRVGYDADILVVGGDVQADITRLADVRAVVLRGERVK